MLVDIVENFVNSCFQTPLMSSFNEFNEFCPGRYYVVFCGYDIVILSLNVVIMLN